MSTLLRKWPMYLIVALAPLCWAGDIVIARGLATTISPFSLVFWRWALATILLAPIAFKPIKKEYPIIKESWGTMWLLSALGISGFISLLYFGVHFTTAINSALIQTLMPGMIVLFCLILYKEKMKKAQIIGLALCFMGAAYVITKGHLLTASSLRFSSGDLLILLGTVLYSLYSSLLPKSPKISPVSFLFSLSAMGAITLLPFYLLELIFVGGFQITTGTFYGILYVAIFPSIVAYICWNKGISELGPATTGLFVNFTPIFAAMLSVPFLGESFCAFHVVGMVFIFSGMAMFNKTHTDAPQPKNTSTNNGAAPDFIEPGVVRKH